MKIKSITTTSKILLIPALTHTKAKQTVQKTTGYNIYSMPDVTKNAR